MTVYIAFAITATIAIGVAVWGLSEAKKYRAYRDSCAAGKRSHHCG